MRALSLDCLSTALRAIGHVVRLCKWSSESIRGNNLPKTSCIMQGFFKSGEQRITEWCSFQALCTLVQIINLRSHVGSFRTRAAEVVRFLDVVASSAS